VKAGKTKRGSPLNLAIKVTRREVRGNRAMLKKEMVTYCLFHAPRDLYWALYCDGAQWEYPYWQERLGEELWKSSKDGMKGVLRNTKDELFTVRKLKEQGTAPELVMAATGP
jgi:hypothetical protein